MTLGIKMIRKSFSWSFVFFKSVWKSLIYLETASATVIFTNSLGWRLNPPIGNHDKAPLTLFPNKNRHNKTINEIK